ncbi:helix-turn-helix domain-containing protein [Cytobacillus kochii]|uniref:helix-turn-helix domain-containing protein n=1 Tax=Cytobacillus kochii TaxID=859143 RepID=UPI001CD53BA1|nr:helix-turn-helix transcriptional regulator [Cytobacillus kochii]MCA1025696.1 helix-turn-helix domain-containing protein [Cytobacillus kochii]
MEKHIEIPIYLREGILKDIDNYIIYQKSKTLNFQDSQSTYASVEQFVVGCVCHYLKQLKYQEDLSGYTDLGKPYKLKNKFRDYMDKKGVIPADLAKKTGIGASNISLILKNKNQPSLDYFLRIWIALECPQLDKVLYREVEK